MTNAIDTVVGRRDGFYYAALRFCDAHDMPYERVEAVAHSLRHKAFMEAIQPYLRLKGEISVGAVPPMILHSDGRIESVGDGMSDIQRTNLALVDDLIAGVARELGLKPGT